MRAFNTSAPDSDYFGAIFACIVIALILVFGAYESCKPVYTCGEATKRCAATEGWLCEDVDRLCETKR